MLDGIHSIDISLSIAPVIHEYIKGYADAMDIDYDEGFEDEEQDKADSVEEAEWFISVGIELINEMKAVIKNPSAFSTTYLRDLEDRIEWQGTRMPSIDGAFPACRDIRRELSLSGTFSSFMHAFVDEMDERGENPAL